MLDRLLRTLESDGYTIEESIMSDFTGEEFWHSAILDRNGSPFSGGFAHDRLAARKVAVAEFLERKKFLEFCSLPQVGNNDWGLSIIPTACGFAAGFDRRNTIIRSIHESAERWLMSKWIDEHFFIPEVTESELGVLDDVSKFLRSQFERVLYFRKSIDIPFGSTVFRVDIAQTMGIYKGGIFPGSSAQSVFGPIWQHALLESYRHLLAIRNNPPRGDIFPDNRVLFFSRNADLALSQIRSANRIDWPVPLVRFHRSEAFESESYFVARTILDGWVSWTEGPIDRFVY